jgi:hypothetical protein
MGGVLVLYPASRRVWGNPGTNLMAGDADLSSRRRRLKMLRRHGPRAQHAKPAGPRVSRTPGFAQRLGRARPAVLPRRQRPSPPGRQGPAEPRARARGGGGVVLDIGALAPATGLHLYPRIRAGRGAKGPRRRGGDEDLVVIEPNLGHHAAR